MALQTSGAISLNEMHIEAGGTTGTTVGINDSDVRDLIGKSSGTSMAFNEWYGASNGYIVTCGVTNNYNSTYNFAGYVLSGFNPSSSTDYYDAKAGHLLYNGFSQIPEAYTNGLGSLSNTTMPNGETIVLMGLEWKNACFKGCFPQTNFWITLAGNNTSAFSTCTFPVGSSNLTKSLSDFTVQYGSGNNTTAYKYVISSSAYTQQGWTANSNKTVTFT